ncbi:MULTISPECIES: protein phosphatase CheZ [unclassified Hahella]|uniref:protein phosphatase CheZ n=1 Tax=unclassified Hahella TaxID=2624107 RepID=UPI001C1EF6F5|nr:MULTISPECIES: protein phosphatase CheZ [unclassified Hahella]MBU6949860.1 protein phosphatase CheZ [Hahella sp. HN01]MDG9668346.1 protein phosphatase CheZ [Hahella sp. CR1]
MTNEQQPPSSSQEEIETRLSEQAASLMEHVSKGDFGEALRVISDLNDTRDRTLYHEVGKLTRSLHEAIRNFNIDMGNVRMNQEEELSKIADASDRLSYVVDMTNKAANKTMDMVEASMPVAIEMKQEAHELKEAWGRLRRREMDPSEFRELYKRIDKFLVDLAANSDKVYTNLSEILLAQDFQDLTGQVINKVTGLVKEVEVNLVKLVAMAGKVDRITGIQHEMKAEEESITKGHGPQIQTEGRSDVVASQDDVDDLLSSLGF